MIHSLFRSKAGYPAIWKGGVCVCVCMFLCVGVCVCVCVRVCVCNVKMEMTGFGLRTQPWQTDRHTDRKTFMQADSQARRPQERRTGRQTEGQVDIHTDMKTDRQAGEYGHMPEGNLVSRQPEMINLVQEVC